MSELQQKKRQIAYKVLIFNILNGIFSKDELYVGYIKLNNKNISRVNLIATVVDKAEYSSYSSIMIDDGTGRIPLRTIENNQFFSKIDVSDVVLVIGRIREFNNERYVMPEVIKKINSSWLNVRRFEQSQSFDNKIIEHTTEETNTDSNINETIYLLIKKMDAGDGVAIDDVVKNSNNSEAERIIYKLLENGDIFEIKPGKLKVLE